MTWWISSIGLFSYCLVDILISCGFSLLPHVIRVNGFSNKLANNLHEPQWRQMARVVIFSVEIHCNAFPVKAYLSPLVNLHTRNQGLKLGMRMGVNMTQLDAGPRHVQAKEIESQITTATPHAYDEKTGFLIFPNVDDYFDPTKKLSFIQALRANDFKFDLTCKQTGVSCHTVYNHRKIDKRFDDAIQESIKEYAEHLEWFSRQQAMEPKATLERIFQLRALLPERYARDLKNSGAQKIEISITGDLIGTQKKRVEVIDADVVREMDTPDDVPAQIPPQVTVSPTVSHGSGEHGDGSGRS